MDIQIGGQVINVWQHELAVERCFQLIKAVSGEATRDSIPSYPKGQGDACQPTHAPSVVVESVTIIGRKVTNNCLQQAKMRERDIDPYSTHVPILS